LTPALVGRYGAALCIVLVLGSVIGGMWMHRLPPLELFSRALECVYQKEACSTAFATWILTLITLFAFLAAFVAALYTRRAIIYTREATSHSRELVNLEYQLVASLYPCRKPMDHATHSAVANLAISQTSGVTSGVPGTPARFQPFLFEARNLGRSPILDFRVRAGFDSSSWSIKQPAEILLGDLASREAVHFVIWIDAGFTFVNSRVSFSDGLSERGLVKVPKRLQSLRFSVSDPDEDPQKFKRRRS
jgi:hypothetical protein